MYRDKGKNYWISTEWGNYVFGRTGTRGMVHLSYNLINKIVFVPEYDIEKYAFPPTWEMISATEKDRLTMDESRIRAFWHADLIFFGTEKSHNRLLPVVYRYPGGLNGMIEEKKLVYCLDPATFEKYTEQLRSSQSRIFQTKKPGFPYPLREDVMDIEAYRFIDGVIREHFDRLPTKFKVSLELE
jgi:hypothetical protein